MDLNEIQNLIKFVSKSGASEVELETKDFKIVIKTPLSNGRRGENEMPVYSNQMNPMPNMGMPMQNNQMMQAMPQANPAPAPEAPKAAATEDSKYITIKSPMIGTFYRSPSPDKPAFINVGDDIKVGSKICIIEAMKLFNEIESEMNGKVIKILVDDSSPVEYDQPLLLIDPS